MVQACKLYPTGDLGTDLVAAAIDHFHLVAIPPKVPTTTVPELV